MENPPKKPTNRDLSAQKEILGELFNDIYLHRGRIYRVNFFRGIFFGLGMVIGSTVLIAIAIAILSLLVDIPGGLGEFINWIVQTIQNR